MLAKVERGHNGNQEVEHLVIDLAFKILLTPALEVTQSGICQLLHAKI